MEIDEAPTDNLSLILNLPTPSGQQLPWSSDSGSGGRGDYETHPTIFGLDPTILGSGHLPYILPMH